LQRDISAPGRPANKRVETADARAMPERAGRTRRAFRISAATISTPIGWLALSSVGFLALLFASRIHCIIYGLPFTRSGIYHGEFAPSVSPVTSLCSVDFFLH